MNTKHTPLLPSVVALAFVGLSPSSALAQEQPMNQLNEFDQALQEENQPADEFWQRPSYLGVKMSTLLPFQKEELLLGENESGVSLSEIVPNSPAAEAGLQEGDILLSLDGSSITDAQELVDLVQENEPGDQIELKLLRGEERLALDVTLGEMPLAFEQEMKKQAAQPLEFQFPPNIQMGNAQAIPLIIPEDGQLILPEELQELLNQDPAEQFEQLRQQMFEDQQKLQLRFEQMHQGNLKNLGNQKFSSSWSRTINGDRTITESSNAQGRVRITEAQGEKPLVELYDADGELFLSERVESLEGDLESIPEEHREQVRLAWNMNGEGFEFNFGLGNDLLNRPQQGSAPPSPAPPPTQGEAPQTQEQDEPAVLPGFF